MICKKKFGFEMLLFLMMLFSTLCKGDTNNNHRLGALILTSSDGHAVGFEMEAELLKKGYDVHLVQVNTIGRIPTQKWANSKLGKQLQNKYYEKLLFVAFGHGNENQACNMTWESMLMLIQLLETKADELSVNIFTCFSGNIADSWNTAGLSEKVKLFSTISCSGKLASGYRDKPSFGQFITGNWYYSRQRSEVNRYKFKNLDCDATFEQVAEAVDDTPCEVGKNCEKIHIHRGQNEKLHSWNLLPVRLVEYANVAVPGFRKEIEFNDGKCENPDKRNFNMTREINIEFDADDFTSYAMDPIRNMKIENVDKLDGTAKNGPEELKKIKPFSTILWINSKQKCNTQSKSCDEWKALFEMKFMRKIKIGYHRGDYKTLLLTQSGQEYSSYAWDEDYEDDDELPYSFWEENKAIIVVCCILVPIGIFFICIIIYCLCQAKKTPSSTSPKHKKQHRLNSSDLSKKVIQV